MKAVVGLRDSGSGGGFSCGGASGGPGARAQVLFKGILEQHDFDNVVEESFRLSGPAICPPLAVLKKINLRIVFAENSSSRGSLLYTQHLSGSNFSYLLLKVLGQKMELSSSRWCATVFASTLLG